MYKNFKFKVGDIIYLRDDLVIGENYSGITYFQSMNYNEMYILRGFNNGFLSIESQFNIWGVSPEMVGRVIRKQKERSD